MRRELDAYSFINGCCCWFGSVHHCGYSTSCSSLWLFKNTNSNINIIIIINININQYIWSMHHLPYLQISREAFLSTQQKNHLRSIASREELFSPLRFV